MPNSPNNTGAKRTEAPTGAVRAKRGGRPTGSVASARRMVMRELNASLKLNERVRHHVDNTLNRLERIGGRDIDALEPQLATLKGLAELMVAHTRSVEMLMKNLSTVVAADEATDADARGPSESSAKLLNDYKR